MPTIRTLAPRARAGTFRRLAALVLAAAVPATCLGETFVMPEPPAPVASASEATNPVAISAVAVTEVVVSEPKSPVVRASATRPAPVSNERAMPPAPAYVGAGTARVDLKCWQHGVLIVHETRLVAAVEPFHYAVKFPSPSSGGIPTYLADSRNATCLIKPASLEADTTPRRR